MGLLKKVFKPVSKVLDKIIPNEVKPFLPYAAAFAPMIAPGIMGAFGNSMLSRAAIGGGLNIFGQLSQEGNEGDINLLSAGLGALTGAMTKPTGVDFSMSGPGEGPMITKGSADIFRSKAAEIGTDTLRGKGLEALAKGSDIFAAGMKDPFSMAGLKAAAIPAATATGDLLFAQAKRDQDEYDRLMEEEAAARGEDDANRAFAIRQAMEAYGFSEDEILDAIAAAGYKKGGRVGFNIGGGTGGLLDMLKERIIAEPFKGEEGYIEEGVDMEEFKESEPEEIEADQSEKEGMFKIKDKPIFILPMDMKKGGRVGLEFGGITEAVETIEQKPKEFLVDKLKVTQMPGQSEMRAIIEAMYNDTDGVMPDDRKKEFYELYSGQMLRNGEMDDAEFEFIQTEILGKEMKEGGRVDLREGGILGSLINPDPRSEAMRLPTQQPLNNFGSFRPQLAQMPVFPRLNQLEQGVDRAEETLGRIRSRLGAEQTGATQLTALQPAIGIQTPPNMLSILQQRNDLAQGMKDGGMMDLGGKEMDLRGGGFVPIGKKERADDVPARLSKNEFVMTADAVRAAGGGSVNKGAKRMYKLMNDLEARV